MDSKKCKLYLATLTLFSAWIVASGQRCYHHTLPRHEPRQCDGLARYRTISGRCNNLAHPEWGSAGLRFRRLVASEYADKRETPRGGRHPSALPNPRWISQKNHPDNDVPDHRFTHMVMQFGQFLDHDLTLTPKDETTNCCDNGVQAPDCFTIPIPNPDRFYSWVNSSAQCLNFVRSRPVCNTNKREQFNELTAFVDASNVYGSDQEHAAILRTYVDGRLQRSGSTDQLPTRDQLNLRPNTRKLRPEKPEDFMAGDMRVNEHPFLATLHVVFLREHNRIAKRLRQYLPEHLRDDETLYQETRRLVGAEMQNIVYGEYLPTVLGVDFMRRYDLIVAEETTYDEQVDPSIFNSFASAAFRFGHSMINGMFKLVSQRRTPRQQKDVYWLWRLREVFDGQSIRGARLPLENMLEGLTTQEPQTCDAFFTTEITDHLFQKNSKRQNFGDDLLALNIQRGRDHGLPGYSKFRRACGLRALSSWTERPSELSQDYWEKLREVYDRPADIDLYVGAIGEESVRGGVVGPTFACLIGDTFNRLKKGDRFFYTHTNANGLGPVARQQVLQRTMGDIICDVSQMDQIQKWVTLQPNGEYNSYESCFSKTYMDLEAIAAEIASELGPGHRSPRGRHLVNGGPPAGNNLLFRAESKPIRFNEGDAIPRPDGAGSESVEEEAHRVPNDFRFPPEVLKGEASNRRSSFVPPPASVSTTTTRRQNGSSVGQRIPQARTLLLQNRLATNVGVSSHACLFKLC